MRTPGLEHHAPLDGVSVTCFLDLRAEGAVTALVLWRTVLRRGSPAAAPRVHETFWGGHFVQEDGGDYLAERIVSWMA